MYLWALRFSSPSPEVECVWPDVKLCRLSLILYFNILYCLIIHYNIRVIYTEDALWISQYYLEMITKLKWNMFVCSCSALNQKWNSKLWALWNVNVNNIIYHGVLPLCFCVFLCHFFLTLWWKYILFLASYRSQILSSYQDLLLLPHPAMRLARRLTTVCSDW